MLLKNVLELGIHHVTRHQKPIQVNGTSLSIPPTLNELYEAPCYCVVGIPRECDLENALSHQTTHYDHFLQQVNHYIKRPTVRTRMVRSALGSHQFGR
uniref:Uncharacterized protein n=1 Tax=Babesia bovis TaxID=5865 RepID=S6C7X4_BABBO|nr:hypothetical protein [Babesia bovis]